MKKVTTQQKIATQAMGALLISSALLAAAAAGYVHISKSKTTLHVLPHYPYQTVGYTPGYTPGYIPGRVPGYSVPGYVPGYGIFSKLSAEDFIAETRAWILKHMK